MQSQPMEAQGRRMIRRIEIIADDRVMYGQEMHADLVRPPRFRAYLKKGKRGVIPIATC